MLYKSVKVISDQFEHLYICLLFGEIAKTGVAEGGFPYSHITLSQNVNILVKTKNALKALKRQITLIFCDMSVPILGEGSAHLGIIRSFF